MGDSVGAMATSVEMRQAQHVNYSVVLVGSIAAEYDATVDGDQMTAAAAMVEAFWVHIRLLAEFLTRDAKGNDMGPGDFGIDWVIPATDEAVRLGRYWLVASRHVVHFSQLRVADHDPGDDTEQAGFEVSGGRFTAMVRDVLAVYATFVGQLLIAYPPVPATEPIPNSVRQPIGWHERLLRDRSRVLTDGFFEACERVGLDGHALLNG